MDRADLWDLRPTAGLDKYTYKWACDHRISGDWDTIVKVGDVPYDRDAAPTKIPGAALEFNISSLGKVKSVDLDIASAICIIIWENGTNFRICIDAEGKTGRYSWTGASINPVLIAPAYVSNLTAIPANEVVDGQDLRRLGYPKGTIRIKNRISIYNQTCWGPLKYQAAVCWRKAGQGSEGAFSISSHYSDCPKAEPASGIVKKAIKTSFDNGIALHKQWWKQYWAQSAIHIPDQQLEKQWYLEMYKFGSASRKGSPPISLQAVWTADNDKLPPWKGDFHSDLNTQLSYWPAYSSNHLEEGSVFTDWLWDNKACFEQYAKQVFGAEGLNVPGVATLRGQAMGGWHMYSMSPTVACWLSQNFYLQWKYSMDKKFLNEKAYPWINEAARFIEDVSIVKDGVRVLPMSSSPEFRDNSIEACFLQMTNYDRSLCKYIFNLAAELAVETGKQDEASHWELVGSQFPAFVVDEKEGLLVAPGYPYNESHRHFSHLLAIHPLGLLNFDDPAEREIIENSLANLEKQGTSQWCGYSFSWLGNIYARMKQGEKAAVALRTFSTCFCLPNSFHVNGDQCKAGHSKFTYRPFTLEGNFAFAAGIQEMMLQSQNSYIEVFPALPVDWKDAAFDKLRAEGAFLVSAEKTGGQVELIRIEAEQGGTARILLPFPTHYISSSVKVISSKMEGKILVVQFEKGGSIQIRNGYE